MSKIDDNMWYGRLRYNMTAMDAFASCLWILYDCKCDDIEIIESVFYQYCCERSCVLKNPINGCGHYLDNELAEWLYSLDIEGVEDVSKVDFKALEDC